MARIILLPYRFGSASCLALRDSLQSLGHRALRVRVESPRFQPRDSDVIINWGSSEVHPLVQRGGNYYNHTDNVAIASNKLTTFQHLMSEGIPTPEWTTDFVEADRWKDEGHTVICRTSLRGHSGHGIVINRPSDEELPRAPLYTKYKKKKQEFRVHVFNGVVFDVQEKRRMSDFERTEDEALIRSHQNGWVFCRDNISYEGGEELLHRLASDTIITLGLDFGAVDIIYNKRDNRYYVLEVNTAVGLEGETLEKYTNQIASLVS